MFQSHQKFATFVVVDKREARVFVFTASGMLAQCAAVDIREPASVQQFLGRAKEQFGSLAGVVSVTGPAIPLRPLAEVSVEDFRRILETDVLGSFNILWAATHEWVGIAKDVWRAPNWSARLNYMIRPPGWSHDGSRDTSETIKARWEAARHEGGQAWKKPTSSSSDADRAGAPSQAA